MIDRLFGSLQRPCSVCLIILWHRSLVGRALACAQGHSCLVGPAGLQGSCADLFGRAALSSCRYLHLGWAPDVDLFSLLLFDLTMVDLLWAPEALFVS